MYIDPYGVNPFAGLEKQLRDQLAQIEEMGRQSVQRAQVQPGYDPAFTQTIRQEVDRYMQERQPVPQPMQEIVSAVEQTMPTEDLNFLAGNISALPVFLRSSEGKSLLALLVEGMKKSGSCGADNPGETTQAG
ncbi:hypothetical protein [Enterobacter hormaechei]|uniref:hypothetical protein n=1 Tax=Enterobacter hormaechei TaxID=158836 RepID=UPI0034D1A513